MCWDRSNSHGELGSSSEQPRFRADEGSELMTKKVVDVALGFNSAVRIESLEDGKCPVLGGQRLGSTRTVDDRSGSSWRPRDGGVSVNPLPSKMGTRSALVAAAVVAAFVACTSRDKGFDGPSSDRLTDDAGEPEAAPRQTCEGKKCSRDLHTVVDGCTEAVLEECAAGLACSNGGCVTACDSALVTAQGCSLQPSADAHLPNSSCFALPSWQTPGSSPRP